MADKFEINCMLGFLMGVCKLAMMIKHSQDCYYWQAEGIVVYRNKYCNKTPFVNNDMILGWALITASGVMGSLLTEHTVSDDQPFLGVLNDF